MVEDADDLSAQPSLGLLLHEGLSDDIEAEFRACLGRSDLKLEVLRHPGGPYASAEFYVPTTIALFITAGFFSGFLQEAGKDAYVAFKRAATVLWRRAASLRVVAVGTAGKISPAYPYSLAYSITGEVVPGLRFKFLIQTEIGGVDAEAGIGAFVDLIDDLLNDRISEEDVRALLTYKPVNGTVFVTFDPLTRKIIPVNARERRG